MMVEKILYDITIRNYKIISFLKNMAPLLHYHYVASMLKIFERKHTHEKSNICAGVIYRPGLLYESRSSQGFHVYLSTAINGLAKFINTGDKWKWPKKQNEIKQISDK